jgi:hypothetical protein
MLLPYHSMDDKSNSPGNKVESKRTRDSHVKNIDEETHKMPHPKETGNGNMALPTKNNTEDFVQKPRLLGINSSNRVTAFQTDCKCTPSMRVIK